MLVRLLGPVELRDPAGRFAAVSQPLRRTLLAMLAVTEGRVVTSQVLVDALWGEEVSRAREANLHSQVSRLRQVLDDIEQGGGSRLVRVPSGYRLALAQHELDVTMFRLLADRGRQAARNGDVAAARQSFAEALAMWRGSPLADVAGICPRLAGEAASLDGQLLAVLQERLDCDLALGRHREAAEELGRLAAEYPLREQLAGQLMVALYRCGRRGEALAVFDRTRRALAEELGLDPGPDLAETQRRVLADDPTLAVPAMPGPGQGSPGREPDADPQLRADSTPHRRLAPHRVVPRQLPTALRHFAGRAAELKELDAQLDLTEGASGTVVITAIGGVGGIGKTALALHWAHSAANQFPDGQLYVNLRGYDPGGSPVTPAQAVRGFLGALGIPPSQIPSDPHEQAGLYRSLMSDRKMLILADNARDPAHVRPLIPTAPGSLLLVTSRDSLAGLAAADGAALIPLGPLDDDDAMTLLAARLGPERLAGEPKAAADLIRLCGRLPLALAITAARASAPERSLAALAAAMTAEADRLDALDTGEATTSVRAVFSWSCLQLPEPALRMFRMLGLHPGPDITIAAAASLAGVDGPQARRLLTTLTTASLLSEHARGRFAMHDLLRAYAAECCHQEETDSERKAATERMLSHYLHTAYVAAVHIYQPRVTITLPPAISGAEPECPEDREQAEGWFQRERQVLLGLAQHAASLGMHPYSWQIPWTMGVFLDRFGYWSDWMASQRIALAAAESHADDYGQGHAHLLLGRAYWKLGDFAAAAEHDQCALNSFTAAGNVPGQARAHTAIGVALAERGRSREALDHQLKAAELYEASGVLAGLGDALNNAGCDYAGLGEFSQAISCCRRALDLHTELGTVSGQANAADSLGEIYRALGDYDAASSYFRLAADFCVECGDAFEQGRSLIGLGDTYDLAGQRAAAIAAWQQALDCIGEQYHPDFDRVRNTIQEFLRLQ
jgi:DNA-binding SARP family transcriptional activator